MNAFLDLAERQVLAPVKARRRATETRRARAQAKTLAERDAQFRRWKHEHREGLDAALAGPHGGALARLVAFLDAMTMESANALVECVRADGWHSADTSTRFLVLHLIGAAIVQLREQSGLPPFDDPLFDQPPNVFLALREMLR
jgi:hypothetical protein